MRTFKDSEGREIRVAVNVGVIMRVKQELSLDLTTPAATVPGTGMSLMAALSGLDVLLQVAVLYYACEDSLQKLEIDQVGFAKLLDGAGLARAQDAFLEEWLDFSQGSNRTDLAKAIRAGKDLVAASINKQTKAIEKAFQIGEKRIDQVFEKTLNEIAAESPSAGGSLV
jgi:hypothetical protein